MKKIKRVEGKIERADLIQLSGGYKKDSHISLLFWLLVILMSILTSLSYLI